MRIPLACSRPVTSIGGISIAAFIAAMSILPSCAPPPAACMGAACGDTTVPDLAISTPDLSRGCVPACGGQTPYCAGLSCVGCLVDAHCALGQVCSKSGTCVPGCGDDSRCHGDGGVSTMSCCGGACVDTSGDVANCGGCGLPCSVAHATSTCAAGKCSLKACAAGWGDCNGDPKDGCETNLHVDPANCGKCGAGCSITNAIAGCADTCYLAACKFGFDDCNNDPMDGCETPVATDPKNCGACGNSCANVPHGTASCANALCGIKTCDVGFADCDGDGKNGCETAVGTDAKNCGKCGAACAQGLVCTNGGCTCPQCNIPNSKTACMNNQCVFDSCLQGFGNCDNNVANGCEVNLNSDRNNCNGCGMACPQGQNCFNGVCQAKFVFQLSQTIDGQTVKCSSVMSNTTYTECDDLQENAMYFPNGVSCGPMWSMQNSPYTDLVGFCASLTGTAKMEVYYTCSNSIPRTTWKNHVWGTTNDNGYSQHLRCYY